MENAKSTLINDEIYVPIFENKELQITISQGKGAIFFSTENEAIEFVKETKEKDPKGNLTDCTYKVLKYKKVE